MVSGVPGLSGPNAPRHVGLGAEQEEENVSTPNQQMMEKIARVRNSRQRPVRSRNVQVCYFTNHIQLCQI